MLESESIGLRQDPTVALFLALVAVAYLAMHLLA